MQWIYFTFIYENRRMKPVEIVLRRKGGEKDVVSTNVSITKYATVQLLYSTTNKKITLQLFES
jgi:hypothetical protein